MLTIWNFLKRYWLPIIALLIIASAASVFMYRNSLTRMLDKSEYSALSKDIRNAADAGSFTSQASLSDYITSWADANGLKYKKDRNGNIVFYKAASERKKKLSPTIICVSYNYETARENAHLLAGAAMIAKADITSGRRTVIFFNDEQNNGSGYLNVSTKLFKNKPKVIYLDYGNSSYISNSSFAKKHSSIRIKASRVKPVCDTAVKVRISGIRSDIIGANFAKHPDVVSALSTLLTRLKSKSVVFQLADLKLGSNGSMYPVSLDAVIMLNSYAVPSFTKYIDTRIRSMQKTYGKDYPEISFTYEVIDDPNKLPEEAYTRRSTATLTNVLYTIQSGLYQYDNNDKIPEGHKQEDIYGINAVTDIRPESGRILIDIMTQAYDDTCMDRIMSDNTASAELFGCSLEETSSYARFVNERDSLQRTIASTHSKLTGTSAGSSLSLQDDSIFTPCSYLMKKNPKADIIHIRLNSDNASSIINTIICYIAYKGNNFLL